ncbi:MAG TPA: DUF1566 domain-containing protein [Bryobacteraceae bacterium]
MQLLVRPASFAKVVLAAILTAACGASAQGALLQRLNGAAVYDTDLNVTWLVDADLAQSNSFNVVGIAPSGIMSWSNAQNFIVAMNAANYLGFSTWRLPSTQQPDPSCSTQDAGNHVSSNFGCTGSEMGHLFYNELGGMANTALSAVHNANYGSFRNLQDGGYWSDTTYSLDNSGAWLFQFQNGAQVTSGKQQTAFLVMAVISGDVSSPKVLPQIAFGGGWYSALYFTTSGAGTASFQINFVNADGTPMNVPSLGGTSTTVNLVGHGTSFVEAPNNGLLTQGYASFSLPPGVSGYGVFRQSVEGRADQEVVVPLSDADATTATLIWDDTNLTTSVAMVNLSASPNIVTVTVRDFQGRNLGTSRVSIVANGRVAVALRDLPGLGGIVGNRGSADFTVTSGNVAVLGLRFRGAAFASIPVVK